MNLNLDHQKPDIKISVRQTSKFETILQKCY